MSRMRPVVSEHPMKVRVESFAPDGSLKAEKESRCMQGADDSSNCTSDYQRREQ